MKSLKSKIKNINGITLISLVVTIIILIILAGITLNMLLGENGIINRTKTAKEQNDKATATETMNLKITNVQISKYAEEQRMPTLKELADNFCEDDDFQYVQETSEVASLTKITNNNPTSIYTKLKAYPYEFEINSSLQLASIDGIKVATVPANDGDTIVSMTKAELDNYIETAINAKLQGYAKTTDLASLNGVKSDVLYTGTANTEGASYNFSFPNKSDGTKKSLSDYKYLIVYAMANHAWFNNNYSAITNKSSGHSMIIPAETISNPCSYMLDSYDQWWIAYSIPNATSFRLDSMGSSYVDTIPVSSIHIYRVDGIY